MKKYFKVLIIDGILFMVPLILLIYLARFLFDFAMQIIEPITKILPVFPFFGMPNLTALIILFLLIIIFGYLSRSYLGKIISDLVKSFISKIIPGFSIIQKLFYDPKESFDERKIKPALAFIDDAYLFAFILEEKNDIGLLTVYVPSAPIPTSGNVYLMREEQVKRLDISLKDTVKCITQLGVGSPEIIKGKVKMDL